MAFDYLIYFNFRQHISLFLSHTSCHLRRIRRYKSISIAKTISTALISSGLDSCNSLLNNIGKRDLAKLQRVQHCLARVVLRAPRFSPSLFKQLHWLPVTYIINVKLSTPTYRVLSTQQPSYLDSLLHLSNIPRRLRSSISQNLLCLKQSLTWANVLSLLLLLGSGVNSHHFENI